MWEMLSENLVLPLILAAALAICGGVWRIFTAVPRLKAQVASIEESLGKIEPAQYITKADFDSSMTRVHKRLDDLFSILLEKGGAD